MLELKDDNGNLLPKKIQKRVNDFLEHLKEVTWFKPSKDLKKTEADKQAEFVLECFGIEAEIEYRKLETEKDWNLAYDLVRDLNWVSAHNSAEDLIRDLTYNSAWNSVWDLAWDLVKSLVHNPTGDSAYNLAWSFVYDSARISTKIATELLVIDNEDFKKQYPNGAFIQLFKLWEMGLYPVGILEENNKFVIYADPKYCLKENGRFE